MRDIAPVLDSWLAGEGPLALSTVVHTWGSGPRRPGARMTIDREGRIAGSVSGGCVESSVVETAREVIESGEPRLLRFAVSDELAWGVGLACGGSLTVFVERADRELLGQVREGMRRRDAVVLAVVTSGPNLGDSLVKVAGSPGIGSRALVDVADAALAAGKPLATDTEHGSVFCDVILPSESLVIVGGVHIAQTLCGLAAGVGYRPVICDPRPVFASPGRFPGVEIVNEWPAEGFRRIGLDASTAVATLTHDPKLDDPALALALDSPAFYVGRSGAARRTRGASTGCRSAASPRPRLAGSQRLSGFRSERGRRTRLRSR